MFFWKATLSYYRENLLSSLFGTEEQKSSFSGNGHGARGFAVLRKSFCGRIEGQIFLSASDSTAVRSIVAGVGHNADDHAAVGGRVYPNYPPHRSSQYRHRVEQCRSAGGEAVKVRRHDARREATACHARGASGRGSAIYPESRLAGARRQAYASYGWAAVRRPARLHKVRLARPHTHDDNDGVWPHHVAGNQQQHRIELQQHADSGR